MPDIVDEWSSQLGLAHSPLLGNERDPNLLHHALLDGVEGSFTLSLGSVDRDKSLDWTWSSQIGTHVQVEQETVIARPAAGSATALRFHRPQVERNLEGFLETLIAKRVVAPVTIAEHFVGCFRTHRQIASGAGLNTEECLENFLTVIGDEISGQNSPLDERLPVSHRERLQEELRYNRLAGRYADIAITMRHAAGMVFQETHAELVAEPLQPQLFGLPISQKRSTRNSLGAYYTPPGLARILADLVIADHLTKPSLRILDPACGSGIFLCEIVHALRRHNYTGQISLFGYDVSPSAIQMAHFAVRHSSPPGNCEFIIEIRDFLTSTEQASFDIVLMNPPFLAMPDMDSEVRERLQSVLGEAFRYRPDLSMAFTSLGLSLLIEGGTLATLLPSGALSQQGATRWRYNITTANDVELVAVLGDHGMFRDAMVNIAALVVRKTVFSRPTNTVMLWASQKRGASSGALRRLRRWQEGNRKADRSIDWSIYSTSRKSLAERDEWTPRPYSLGNLPERLTTTANVLTVKDLFHVELGIRAGNLKKNLQIDATAHDALPAKERAFFRPVAETRSIRNGRIDAVSWLFYPERALTAQEISTKAPRFFQQHLLSLGLEPTAIVDLERARRETNLRQSPRIVSRAFLGTDSFAVDADGRYVVVQGYSWLPKGLISRGPFGLIELLKDYSFILNSRVFFALLRENGRIVGGGQVDGAKSQVARVPLPDLASLYLETPELSLQADQLREIDGRERPNPKVLDAFAAAAYRTALEEWNIAE